MRRSRSSLFHRLFNLRGACARLVLMLASASVQAATVALTFDDLPVYGRFAPIGEARAVTATLLDGLNRHHLVAIGFVNESGLDGADRAERIALLSSWLDAGMELGNHTWSHPSLTTTSAAAYIADIARGELVTRQLLRARGREEQWFRYPFLETGATEADKRAVEDWLRNHGYRIAPVTMENADWQFATAYDDALGRGDAAAAAHIQAEYVDYSAKAIAWYEQAAKDLLGREPAFVMLLHASRLNAASIDALAAVLARAKLHVVSLDRAMRDPAYRTADSYVGPDGINWLERWSRTLGKPLPYGSFPAVPADVDVADDRPVVAADTEAEHSQ